MNSYFVIVLLGVILFFVVWFLGWLLERLSHILLRTTQEPGSRSWFMLVGPGVALHESSHALGCLITRTEIVEFKPINIEVQQDQIILGYVKYRKPQSDLKNAIINLAPVGVSLLLLIAFAFGATFLVPDRPGLGSSALVLLESLIGVKSNPTLLADIMFPVNAIGSFVYLFLYTFSELTVINPIFWIIAFLAMTIMFSNAPSDVDIRNAATGLKIIIIFNLIWLVVALLLPQAGWILFGLYEVLAVLFSLSLAFAAVGYGFFILVAAMSKLKSPFQLIPILSCIGTGIGLWYLVGQGMFTFTPAFQTVIAIIVITAITLLMLLVRPLRKDT
ncbi:hypothetical protein E4H12_04610 [Candidatus Thorarchaeota archaeon]|nr:MAG: hypothetical protein E4H12_04610 [Candidatus Thorarchaeota archaeon]